MSKKNVNPNVEPKTKEGDDILRKGNTFPKYQNPPPPPPKKK